MTLRVSELNFYPVKSCKGISAPVVRIGLRGVEYDRHWLLVNAAGVALTQRIYPRMCLIGAELRHSDKPSNPVNQRDQSDQRTQGDDQSARPKRDLADETREPECLQIGKDVSEGKTTSSRSETAADEARESKPPERLQIDPDLICTAPGMPELCVRVEEGKHVSAKQSVMIWNDACDAIDLGDEAAQWFASFLDADGCRLVKMSTNFVRAVNPQYSRSTSDQVDFQDGYPLLLISRASLECLNGRLAEPLPMNRFRPNVVVDGCEPFAEDSWDSIEICGIRFSVVKPCERCVITTIDQDNATRSPEPLRSLATFRSLHNKVMFGQNLIHHTQGELRVGSEVSVIAEKVAAIPRLK